MKDGIATATQRAKELGQNALEKAKDAIWNGLGFVLQWAKDGLKRTS